MGIVCMTVLQYELATSNLIDYWRDHPTVFPIKYKEVEVYLSYSVPLLGLSTLLRVMVYAPMVVGEVTQLYKSLDLFFNDPNYYFTMCDKSCARGFSKNPSISSNGTGDNNVLTWEDKIQLCRDGKGLATVREEDSECNGTLLDPKHQTKLFHFQDSFSSHDGGLKMNYSHSVNSEKKWSLFPDRPNTSSLEVPKPRSLHDHYFHFPNKQQEGEH